MPVRRKLGRGIIIGGISTLFIAYHLVIQADALSVLSLIDIRMTTGFKPNLPIYEIGLVSFFISVFCTAKQNEYSDKKWFHEPLVWILAIPAVLLQFIHLVLDHSGRWPLLQNWTHPGEIPDSGLVIYGMEAFFFAFLLSLLGSTMGWLMMRFLFQN